MFYHIENTICAPRIIKSSRICFVNVIKRDLDLVLDCWFIAMQTAFGMIVTVAVSFKLA